MGDLIDHQPSLDRVNGSGIHGTAHDLQKINHGLTTPNVGGVRLKSLPSLRPLEF